MIQQGLLLPRVGCGGCLFCWPAAALACYAFVGVCRVLSVSEREVGPSKLRLQDNKHISLLSVVATLCRCREAVERCRAARECNYVCARETVPPNECQQLQRPCQVELYMYWTLWEHKQT